MRVYFKTLGCRLNEAELEQWGSQFRQQGHHVTNDLERADVVVLNSCAVTLDAGRKSRQHINRLFRDNPEAKLVVTGCYATLNPSEVEEHMGVDLVISNDKKDQLPSQVMERFAIPTMPIMAMEDEDASLFTRGRQRAFIKIQDGCRYRCTFCIVTIARGSERSRSVASIVDEVNKLYQQGLKEIVLTGVHVGGYGSDCDSSLYSLVKTILAETDMPRVRFASVEPWDLHEDFFSLFENQRLMPHMHLPLQSGVNSVLRRMSRRCKTEDFFDLVSQARQAVNGFNITTDIIVGFPGETEAEWESTLAFVEQVGFGHLHIFSYSPRPDTKAARLPDPVPNTIKQIRSRSMHALGDRMKRQFMQSQLNQVVDVLWEKPQVRENNMLHYYGYTPNYLRVETLQPKSTESLENMLVKTRLIGINSQSETSAIAMQGQLI